MTPLASNFDTLSNQQLLDIVKRQDVNDPNYTKMAREELGRRTQKMAHDEKKAISTRPDSSIRWRHLWAQAIKSFFVGIMCLGVSSAFIWWLFISDGFSGYRRFVAEQGFWPALFLIAFSSAGLYLAYRMFNNLRIAITVALGKQADLNDWEEP